MSMYRADQHNWLCSLNDKYTVYGSNVHKANEFVNVYTYLLFFLDMHTHSHTQEATELWMQKQEIPPFTLCHSGSDLALNQLVVLQAISGPPQRLYECTLNSWGPLVPLSMVPTWWVATAPLHTNRTVISRCANQRAVGVRSFCFLCCAASRLVHKGSSPVRSGGSCSTRWPLWWSLTVSFAICALFRWLSVFYSAATRQVPVLKVMVILTEPGYFFQLLLKPKM